MQIIDLALIVIGVFTLFLVFLVYTRNRKNIINQTFSFFLLIAAIWPFSIAFFRITPSLSSAFFWDVVMIYIAGTLVPAIFVYFSFAFTEKKTPPLIYKVVCSITPAVFLIFLLFTDLWIVRILIEPIGKTVELGPVYVAWMIYYGVFMIWGAIFYWRKFRISKGLIRTQMLLVLVALAFPIIGAVMPNIVLPFFGNYRFIFLGPIFLTAMNIIISYAIVKHRFLDIRLLVARSVAYSLLVLILGLFYASGLFLIGSFITREPTSSTNLISSTILALIIALTFQPLRRFFEKVTDKFLYKDRYQTDVFLNKLSHTMASTLTLSNLAFKVLEIIASEMRIEKVSLVLSQKGKIYIVESRHDQGALKISSDDYKKIKSKDKLLVFEELKEGKVKTLLREKGISVVLPLKTKKQFIGFLIFAEKSSGDIYFDQDIKVLEILGPELSVALQNAQRFEEIKQFTVVLQQEVRKATADLRKANKKLLELDKLKDEFISIASHDLRNPMTTIKNYLWMVLEGPKKDAQKTKEHINLAYDATEYAISLVNDILDVSRIEAGRIQLEPEKFDLANLTVNVVDGLKAVAQEKQIDLNFKPVKGFEVRADKDRVRQVIANLIGNALKFTPKQGKITVSLAKANGKVETKVADTGIGIKKKDIDKLFTKFGRVDTSLASLSKTPGTGLGLYISKNIVELSGGKIKVDSTFGKGSTFSFTLPAANVKKVN